MSYTKTQWRNNQSPAINADNLNHIEQGVYDAHQDIAENTQNIESLTTQTGANTSAIALEKTERQQAVTAETLDRESTDNNLQAQIDQLVAPSGTAPNPAEIENARIGADGVTYDTLGNAIRTQVTNLKSDIGVSDVTFTEVTGKYISYKGNEYTSAPFNRSVPIAVNKGEIINFIAAGYNTEVAMIAISNSDATSFTPKVNSIDSTVRLYTYTVEDDGYIVVSYDKSETHELVIKSAEISNEALNNRLNALNENYIKGIIEDSDLSIIVNDSSLAIGQAGKYVNKNSGVSNTDSFSISVPITLEKGQYLIFNARGYLNKVAVLAKVNLDSTYTALIKSVDNDEHTFKYLATENVTVVVSSNNNVSVRYSVFSSRIDKQDMRIKELENDWFAFAKMGIIGDSLASGASNYGGGASDRKLYSWGKYIEREHGVDVSLFSFGGATTRTWLTSNYGYTALQSADVLDLYVIGLGVNDAYELGSEYLGTIADVHVGDESLNADTYYGNYSKIIAAIKAKSPRAKIICLTNPKGTGEVSSTYNQAVRDIVALYTNTYLIDLINDSFYTSAEFNATWYSAHSTAVGYKLISENIYKNISELIRNNVSEFLDIQWIIENHA